MEDLTSREFWNRHSKEYLFRSIWPGGENLLDLFAKVDCINPDDVILETCSGAGDFIILAAEKIKNGQVHGIDFSRSSLEITRHKIAYPFFITGSMLWGRLMGKYYQGSLNDNDLENTAADLLEKKNKNCLALLKNLSLEYIEKMKRYTTASPYSFLVNKLVEMGLFRPADEEFSRRFFRKAKELDDMQIFTRIIDFDKKLQNIGSKIKIANMDSFNLSYENNFFDKVFSSETALLFKRYGPAWLDETIRVCSGGGSILYAGVRIRHETGRKARSEEIDYVVSELEKRKVIEIIEVGEKKLDSWWDLLFNEQKINRNVYTPYVLYRKINPSK